MRNYWLAVQLGRRFAVDLLVADDATPPPDARLRAALDELVVFPGGARSKGRLARVLNALAPSGSYFTSGAYPSAYAAEVARRLGSGRYRAVQFDLHFLAAVAPFAGRVALVYNAHNCESALLLRRAERERAITHALVALDALRVRAMERRAIAASTLVLCCSEDDVVDLARIAPHVRANAVVAPNGVDLATYAEVAAGRPATPSVLISGSMDWRPNQIGLRWFLDEVLPHLRSPIAAERLAIRVAGRMRPDLATELNTIAGITAVPNPPDMRVELARARIVCAPILASSGTRLRILEAWAAGRPVVTTTAGAFGLDYEHEREITIADRPDAFARALLGLLEEPERYERIRREALLRADAYDWERVGDRLLVAYEAALAAAASMPGRAHASTD